MNWHACAEVVKNLGDANTRINLDADMDVISAARKYTLEKGERICIVVGVSPDIPADKDTRLRSRWINEQDILICSNLLNSFYKADICKDKDTRRHRFEFSMRDEIKNQYRDISSFDGGIYLPDVKMIRDGSKRGFPFVEPWEVDLLLVPGKRFPMFAIKPVRI
jgi:hypothetical protein